MTIIPEWTGSFEQHTALGKWLKETRSKITDTIVALDDAQVPGILSPLLKAERALDVARSKLDSQLFHDFPKKSLAKKLSVYYS